MIEIVVQNLLKLGLEKNLVDVLVQSGLLFLVFLLSWIAFLISRGPIIRLIVRMTKYTKNMQWDDIFLEKKVFHRMTYLMPALVLYLFIPLILEETSYYLLSISIINLILLLTGMLVMDAILSALVSIYSNFSVASNVSITPFIQVLKLGLYFVTGILMLSIILQKSPLYFLSGLGALTAILMLVFKDTLMGFVAGIQLIGNKMVAPKDWIEMPGYGADGDVMEITLTSVKVKNFDNTITTIPTYALITQSFKNWRSMSLSGGRRIKRSVYIDQNYICFCTSEMLQRFKKIQLIKETLEGRQKEIVEYNQIKQVDESVLVNGRRITNIGVFRSYVEAYLQQHPMIHQHMTFLVRQLPPSQNGLPIEIYVFCKDTNWVAYEAIQADIFDHILAIVPEFDLRVFQAPSGSDFQKLGH